MAEDLHAITAGSADMSSVATPEGSSGTCPRRPLACSAGTRAGCKAIVRRSSVRPDDLSSFRVSRESAAGDDRTVVSTYRFRCSDGSYRWTEATSRRVAERGSVSIVTTVRDISERQRSEAVLQHRASTDPLTGVANRNVLMDRLQQALYRLDRAAGHPGGAVPGPRPVQGHQRFPRPSGRRRGPPGDGGAAPGVHPSIGHPRSSRGRRVRDRRGGPVRRARGGHVG